MKGLVVSYRWNIKYTAMKLRSYHSIHVHSGINGGHKMDYVRGWAYQQIFLERRLKVKRQAQAIVSSESSALGSGNKALQDGTTEIFCNDNDDDKDRILLFEHHHVYTLGRGANEDNLTFLDTMENSSELRRRLSRTSKGRDSCRLDFASSRINLESNVSVLEQVNAFIPSPAVFAPNGVPIYRIERGGEVTYHGPSQLVVYPLLDLSAACFKKDLHWYLRCIEEVIIRVLNEYDIQGLRDDINTGVWVGKNKIAAVGLSSARWITTHGFALNVDPELNMFDTSLITPCGIKERGVTSIANEISSMDKAPSLQEVAAVFLDKFGEVFGATLQPANDLT
jgi:lipoate-protein ligase B